MLEELGLVSALEWQAQEFEKRSGIRCEFTPPVEEITLNQRSAVALYRTMQEALTNVARHAEATEVSAALRRQDGAIVLEVRDNGRGMPSEALNDASSLGLIGLRERALSLGGRVAFSSRPGKGTAVVVSIPDTAMQRSVFPDK
jgi:signal transduction histidine kinase